jgi:hypothetical protein
VADAIARMKLVSSGKECPTVPPPPPPRLVKGKESHRHFGSYDGDYSYTSTQDTLTSGQQTNTSKSRSRYRREKERPGKARNFYRFAAPVVCLLLARFVAIIWNPLEFHVIASALSFHAL